MAKDILAKDIAAIRWKDVNRPCLLCGERKSQLKHMFRFEILSSPFELRQCEECGLLFNSPRLTDLAPLYAEKYYVFHESEQTRYRRAFDQIKRHLEPSLGAPDGPLDVLEVGSAKGHLLHILTQLGHTVKGVELSFSAAQTAREQFGLDVFNGSIEQYLSEDGCNGKRYDVVWCNGMTVTR